MTYVSVTPEIALDEFPVFAGGLGILEGDKFYAAAKSGIDYCAITLLHKKGYANSNVHGVEKIMAPEPELAVDLGALGTAAVRPWIVKKGSAKAVFLEPLSPERAVNASRQLYSEDSYEDEMVKYALLAKAAAKYVMERIGADAVETIDLQESLSSLLVLAVPESLLQKTRLVIHTQGPWGHPYFSAEFLEKVFGFKADRGQVMLTELALGKVKEAFAVSQKQHGMVLNCFGQYKDKIGYVTNGVNLDRWTHPQIARLLAGRDIADVKTDDFLKAHRLARMDLVDLAWQNKPDLPIDDETMFVSWNRRIVRYKRPYLVERLIRDTEDGPNTVFVLSGKGHPKDGFGTEYVERFRSLSASCRNVVYIPDYDMDKAKVIVAGSDLLLFTPFSGWEACGTSEMKAGINGVPSLSSRDGGSREMIVHGENGWFFGKDLQECINLDIDGRAYWIDEEEYKDFKGTFLAITKLRREEPIKYGEVMVKAMVGFRERCDVSRALREYGIVDGKVKEAAAALPMLRRDDAAPVPQKLRSA